MDQSLQRDFDRIKEKVEKMTGERGDAKKPLATIRRVELSALASLSLKSGTVTTTPTAAQYNALQADVANIFEALQRISNILGNATIPKI
jgi:predicted transcriptional regulator